MSYSTSEAKTIIHDLIDSLSWMIVNDETNAGDTPMPEHGGRSWNEINAYWLDGLDKARLAVERGQAFLAKPDG